MVKVAPVYSEISSLSEHRTNTAAEYTVGSAEYRRRVQTVKLLKVWKQVGRKASCVTHTLFDMLTLNALTDMQQITRICTKLTGCLS